MDVKVVAFNSNRCSHSIRCGFNPLELSTSQLSSQKTKTFRDSSLDVHKYFKFIQDNSKPLEVSEFSTNYVIKVIEW